MEKYIIIFLFITLSFSGFSQEKNLSEEITEIAEQLAAADAGQEDISMYIEQLQELAESPVKINTADEPELSRLFFLSDFQTKALADHIRTSGDIVSYYEIASIPGFDRHTTEMMIPFIDLTNKHTSSPDSVRLRNTLLANFIIKPGEKDTCDLGSSFKLLTKYKFTAGRYSGGFTTEKDQGEKPFDFLSGYLAFSGKGVLRKIIIGDFSARFGQGLNINTGIRTGLSLSAPGYMAARNEVRPYTSTDENNFFRGMAAHLSAGKAGLTIFISHNRIDATTSYTQDSSMLFAERFYESGLHNTTSLILKKDVIAETSYGINLTCNFNHLNTGVCWTENRFSLPLNPDKSDPENLFDFKGDANSVYSAYYNSLINRILLYGEISFNDFHNYAMVQGATVRPSDRLSINLLFRNYTPGYSSFHGNGPGISSTDNNEKGILGNFTFEAARHLFVSAGYDYSNFQWLKYRCSYPSIGKRTEIKIKYSPLENLTLDLAYNFRSAMLDDNRKQGISQIEQTESRWIKGEARYSLYEKLLLLTRIDYKIFVPSGSKGTLFLQDVIFNLKIIPLTLWFRYCMFSTDDWDSRLYTYENDLLYSFSIPALSGKGTRSYLMAKWEIGRRTELRIKYSLTSLYYANDVEEKDELKLQFRIWF